MDVCDLHYKKLGRPAAYVGGAVYAKPSFGTNHPLSFTRQASVVEMCDALGWLRERRVFSSPRADEATLARLHGQDYLSAFRESSDKGSVSGAMRKLYRFGTMENPIFPGVFERAATTVGGSILAAQLAMDGMIVFHPAGGTHHGRPDRASGFCYFNDPAFALLTFLDHGLERVLYVDLDAHHGDGVFDFFESEERVACVSIHEVDRWPYSGALDEQSETALNIPVPQGINDAEYDLLMRQLVLPFAESFDPQAIVITCGADALHGDPLSRMELSNHALWNAALSLCAMVPHAIVLGGGGYNPWTTVRCWAGLWGVLAGEELPRKLPPRALALLAGFESDLVDEDEVEPHWLNMLADPLSKGAVRPEIERLAKSLAKAHNMGPLEEDQAIL